MNTVSVTYYNVDVPLLLKVGGVLNFDEHDKYYKCAHVVVSLQKEKHSIELCVAPQFIGDVFRNRYDITERKEAI